VVKCNLALNVFFGVLWDFRNGVGVFLIVVAVRGWGAAKTGVGWGVVTFADLFYGVYCGI